MQTGTQSSWQHKFYHTKQMLINHIFTFLILACIYKTEECGGTFVSKRFEVGHKLIWITLLNSNEVSQKGSQLSFVVLTGLCKNAFVVSGVCRVQQDPEQRALSLYTFFNYHSPWLLPVLYYVPFTTELQKCRIIRCGKM